MNQKRVWGELTTTSSRKNVVYENDINRAYDLLAAAIIEQAIKDNVGISFFKSDFYQLLTTNMPSLQNGEAVYAQIQKNRQQGLRKGLQKEENRYVRSPKRDFKG